MLNQKDILQTQDMIDKRHLDIRTITMGISLLDCCDPDLKTCCDKILPVISASLMPHPSAPSLKSILVCRQRITAWGRSNFE